MIADKVGKEAILRILYRVWDRVHDRVGCEVGCQVRDQVREYSGKRVSIYAWTKVLNRVQSRVPGRIKVLVCAAVNGRNNDSR
jgi:hypothetical protein